MEAPDTRTGQPAIRLYSLSRYNRFSKKLCTSSMEVPGGVSCSNSRLIAAFDCRTLILILSAADKSPMKAQNKTIRAAVRTNGKLGSVLTFDTGQMTLPAEKIGNIRRWFHF